MQCLEQIYLLSVEKYQILGDKLLLVLQNLKYDKSIEKLIKQRLQNSRKICVPYCPENLATYWKENNILQNQEFHHFDSVSANNLKDKSQEKSQITLYQKIGGDRTLNAVQKLIMKAWKSDKLLQKFFYNSNDEHTLKMINYYKYVFGGPSDMPNFEKFRQIHKKNKISEYHFDRAIYLVFKQFKILGLEDYHLIDIINKLAEIKVDICGVQVKNNEYLDLITKQDHEKSDSNLTDFLNYSLPIREKPIQELSDRKENAKSDELISNDNENIQQKTITKNDQKDQNMLNTDNIGIIKKLKIQDKSQSNTQQQLLQSSKKEGEMHNFSSSLGKQTYSNLNLINYRNTTERTTFDSNIYQKQNIDNKIQQLSSFNNVNKYKISNQDQMENQKNLKKSEKNEQNNIFQNSGKITKKNKENIDKNSAILINSDESEIIDNIDEQIQIDNNCDQFLDIQNEISEYRYQEIKEMQEHGQFTNRKNIDYKQMKKFSAPTKPIAKSFKLKRKILGYVGCNSAGYINSDSCIYSEIKNQYQKTCQQFENYEKNNVDSQNLVK